jgi:hypothetical protein
VTSTPIGVPFASNAHAERAGKRSSQATDSLMCIGPNLATTRFLAQATEDFVIT